MKKIWMVALAALLVLATATASGQVVASDATDAIDKASIAADFAAQAGARTHAPTLFEDGSRRLDHARAELKAGNEGVAARAAVESIEAYRAAEAKARWLSTMGEIRTLASDLDRLGVEVSQMDMVDEGAVLLDIGEDSRERVRNARALVDAAKAMRPTGEEGAVLERAEALLGSAARIVREARNNPAADHLAYVSSMLARQAIYGTRLREISAMLPELRLRRTELSQAAMAEQAERERREREVAEQELERLRLRLEQEQSQREAEQAQIQRLRRDLQRQQEILAAQFAGSTAARVEAEQRLDRLRSEYEAELRSAEADASEVETLRQRIEDQEYRMARIIEEERQSEQSLLREIEALRSDLRRERQRGLIPEEEIRRREAELIEREREIERMRQERAVTLEERRRAETAYRERVADAEREMREMRRQSEVLEAELAEERAAREAAERELQRVKAEAQTQATEQQARERELEAIRRQLAELAETRSDDRGFIVTLPGLFFDTGKSTLKAGTKANLTKIADLLEQMEQVRVVVEGHTDSVGGEQMNQRLSEARAEAVRDWLVAQGMPARAITTVGYGETRPVASNDTADGRSRNRRVEIVIEEQ